jgi:outer membrane receptor for ferrienterochelin and colicins
MFGESPLPKLLGAGWKLAPVIPSLQLRYSVSRHSTLRASVAQAFRSPTIKELHFLFVDINHNVRGNQNLQPELANSMQGSFDYRHKITASQGATFTVKGFHNRVKNQIQLGLIDATSLLYQYINIGKAQSYGGSAEILYSSQRFNGSISATQVFSNTWITDTSKVNAWNTLQLSFSGSVTFPKYGCQVQLFGRYSGKNFILTPEGKSFEINPYGLVDLSISKSISIKKTGWERKSLSIQGGVKNLLGVTQIAGAAITGGVHGNSSGMMNIGTGRNPFLSLNLQF